MSNEKIIWDFLIQKGLSNGGAAGLMGNLYAESGLRPNNLQNTFEKILGYTDEEYTSAVDSGNYDNFIYDSAGYGLAQWTWWSRKKNLLIFAKNQNKSIGDLNMQLDFLWQELTNEYKNILDQLKNELSVREASNLILLNFERPSNQSEAVQIQRAQFGQVYYDKYAIIKSGGKKMKYNDTNKPIVCMMTQSTCYKNTGLMNIKGVLWHSTGANNPYIFRYVQPDDNAPNRAELINLLGINRYNNDWNHKEVQAGLNCWIGKLANGTIATVQTMPWNYRPWGCGYGPKGSCNNGWIQFEICEDGLQDKEYAMNVYKEACELTAYLCKMFHIDPNGTVMYNGVQVPTILCHKDSCQLGLGGNHGDVLHWFPKFGKTMESVRADVTNILQEEEEENMTQEKFNEMMNAWLEAQAEREPSSWSKEAREWAESNGFIKGDEKGHKMYKKPLTREEFVQVLYRIEQP